VQRKSLTTTFFLGEGQMRINESRRPAEAKDTSASPRRSPLPHAAQLPHQSRAAVRGRGAVMGGASRPRLFRRRFPTACPGHHLTPFTTRIPRAWPRFVATARAGWRIPPLAILPVLPHRMVPSQAT
jgi:hypothetical protein